ncbi:MAG: allantoinase AllB [Bacteroidia bacterium]
MSIDLALKSKNVLTPNGFVDRIVLIGDGKIIDVVNSIPIGDNSLSFGEGRGEVMITDAGDSIIMPGIIDPHVHINEPGRTEWEGFDTATKAAAAGGITTMIEMPLNASPVTTTKINFQTKLDAAKNKLHVNCGFWGGVVPDNLNELEELLDSGVFGLKAFLTHSGIDDFPNTNEEHLRKALLTLKKYNKPLLVHCELDTIHDDLKFLDENPKSYAAYLKSRPKSWENNAIKLMIDLCRETHARVHIVHLSSAESIEQIQKAKTEGLPLTVETAPHYLFFNAEEIPDGATQYKCAPPIREKENNEKLWNALRKGIIDFIATDHSPALPELKEIESGNFKKAWGGVAGLQFSLPAVWTKAREKNIPITQMAKWLSENPAKFIGLENIKGKIQKGFDADIVVWNPEKKFTVKENMIQHRHKITPYLNRELFGVAEQTYVNGRKVFDNGSFINLNCGKIMTF